MLNMTNRYLKCILKENIFWSLLEIELNEELYKIPCKTDTGCAYSNLPIKNIVSEKVAYNMKLKDIKNRVSSQRSYEVSDTEETKRKDKMLIMQGILLECTSRRRSLGDRDYALKANEKNFHDS